MIACLLAWLTISSSTRNGRTLASRFDNCCVSIAHCVLASLLDIICRTRLFCCSSFPPADSRQGLSQWTRTTIADLHLNGQSRSAALTSNSTHSNTADSDSASASASPYARPTPGPPRLRSSRRAD
ncbi:hypothetical protein K466DRAFT_218553 [Polyporus arcularius HHB13444]|uniref:Secreted protein n=1 Tax=Polyporus arcularius HHB13444 TaxID=1314778 RepID=A0A5C3PTT7_9APHY|nr:hypothetical protein K466DRAFT_218553 [Polyporus arcularius HHB13444]